MIEQIIGWIATILFCSMMIPKVTKVIQTRNVEGNIYMHILYLIGYFLAFTYSTMVEQAPFQFLFAIMILVSSIYLFIHYMYKIEEGKSA